MVSSVTEVSFYTGVPDRLDYVCRLLRKANAQGAKVCVCGPAAALDRLDALLWSFEPTEFLPHLRLKGEGRVLPPALRDTPICLAGEPSWSPHREVLLNLSDDMVPGFDAFERVLEVVSVIEDDAAAGRRRFKTYRSQGFAVKHHEVSS